MSPIYGPGPRRPIDPRLLARQLGLLSSAVGGVDQPPGLLQDNAPVPETGPVPYAPIRQPGPLVPPSQAAQAGPPLTIWDRIRSGGERLFGIPQDGLLSPADRSYGLRQGLLTAGAAIANNDPVQSTFGALANGIAAGRGGAASGIQEHDAFTARAKALNDRATEMTLEAKYAGKTDPASLRQYAVDLYTHGLPEQAYRVAQGAKDLQPDLEQQIKVADAARRSTFRAANPQFANYSDPALDKVMEAQGIPKLKNYDFITDKSGRVKGIDKNNPTAPPIDLGVIGKPSPIPGQGGTAQLTGQEVRAAAQALGQAHTGALTTETSSTGNTQPSGIPAAVGGVTSFITRSKEAGQAAERSLRQGATNNYNQSADQWVDAYFQLQPKGRGAPSPEIRKQIRDTYFGSAGDNAANVRQKTEARKLRTAAILRAVANGTISSLPGFEPDAPAQPLIVDTAQ